MGPPRKRKQAAVPPVTVAVEGPAGAVAGTCAPGQQLEAKDCRLPEAEDYYLLKPECFTFGQAGVYRLVARPRGPKGPEATALMRVIERPPTVRTPPPAGHVAIASHWLHDPDSTTCYNGAGDFRVVRRDDQPIAIQRIEGGAGIPLPAELQSVQAALMSGIGLRKPSAVVSAVVPTGHGWLVGNRRRRVRGRSVRGRGGRTSGPAYRDRRGPRFHPSIPQHPEGFLASPECARHRTRGSPGSLPRVPGVDGRWPRDQVGLAAEPGQSTWPLVRPGGVGFCTTRRLPGCDALPEPGGWPPVTACWR